MSVVPEPEVSGPISTRNGVPPDGWSASDPPGGVPRISDPLTAPHPAPSEGEPVPTGTIEELPNEPPKVPPHQEAKRSHHKAK